MAKTPKKQKEQVGAKVAQVKNARRRGKRVRPGGGPIFGAGWTLRTTAELSRYVDAADEAAQRASDAVRSARLVLLRALNDEKAAALQKELAAEWGECLREDA